MDKQSNDMQEIKAEMTEQRTETHEMKTEMMAELRAMKQLMQDNAARAQAPYQQ